MERHLHVYNCRRILYVTRSSCHANLLRPKFHDREAYWRPRSCLSCLCLGFLWWQRFQVSRSHYSLHHENFYSIAIQLCKNQNVHWYRHGRPYHRSPRTRYTEPIFHFREKAFTNQSGYLFTKQGHIQYDQQYKDLPVTFRDGANPGN